MYIVLAEYQLIYTFVLDVYKTLLYISVMNTTKLLCLMIESSAILCPEEYACYLQNDL